MRFVGGGVGGVGGRLGGGAPVRFVVGGSVGER